MKYETEKQNNASRLYEYVNTLRQFAKWPMKHDSHLESKNNI